MLCDHSLNRRKFLLAAAASTAALSTLRHASAAPAQRKYEICAFQKYLQSLTYEQLAERIANLGFDGIEATVRNGGHVLPERVEDDLPKMVEALHSHGLKISVMASSINRIDQPHAEKVLRTAASLGVKCYRMAYFKYDLKRPVQEQIEQFRPAFEDLAGLNSELGIQAVYQNHAGARNFGCAIWDAYQIIEDYPVEQLGIAFDIRHATVEGGTAWPLHFQLVRPHLGAVFVKDFFWEKGGVKNVPLGEGQVDRKFFSMLRESDFAGPISLHVEYDTKANLEEHVAFLKKDLETLRSWLAS